MESAREHRCAVIHLARYRAKKAVEAALRAQGKRPILYSPAVLRALAEAKLELNRISLIAEADKAIATSPHFAYLRRANVKTSEQTPNEPKSITSAVQILGAK